METGSPYLLFPLTRAWTRTQRWLIIGSAGLGLLLFASLIYGYERYYRGPGEQALYGVWDGWPNCFNEPMYFQFGEDHNFSFVTSPKEGEPFGSEVAGRWFAGGPNIYLRLPADSHVEILHIVSIEPNEIHVRYHMDDDFDWILRRVDTAALKRR